MMDTKFNYKELTLASNRKKLNEPKEGYRKLTAAEIEAVYLNKKIEKFVARMILNKAYDYVQAENAILLIGEVLNILQVPLAAKMSDICKILISFIGRELGFIYKKMDEDREARENKTCFKDQRAKLKKTKRALASKDPKKINPMEDDFREKEEEDKIAEEAAEAWGSAVEMDSTSEDGANLIYYKRFDYNGLKAA